jgi:hypothetical protein
MPGAQVPAGALPRTLEDALQEHVALVAQLEKTEQALRDAKQEAAQLRKHAKRGSLENTTASAMNIASQGGPARPGRDSVATGLVMAQVAKAKALSEGRIGLGLGGGAHAEGDPYTARLTTASASDDGHTAYCVELHQRGELVSKVSRRYSEFDQLRKMLRGKRNGTTVDMMHFPGKTLKFRRQNSEKVTEERKMDLQKWLNAVMGVAMSVPELSDAVLEWFEVRPHSFEAEEALAALNAMSASTAAARGSTAAVAVDSAAM